jgi:hypothetical protein
MDATGPPSASPVLSRVPKLDQEVRRHSDVRHPGLSGAATGHHCVADTRQANRSRGALPEFRFDVELLHGATALIAPGGQQGIAILVLVRAARRVDEPPTRARFRILLPAFGALRIADSMVDFFVDCEERLDYHSELGRHIVSLGYVPADPRQ